MDQSNARLTWHMPAFWPGGVSHIVNGAALRERTRFRAAAGDWCGSWRLISRRRRLGLPANQV
jgi:hypothetical protein